MEQRLNEFKECLMAIQSVKGFNEESYHAWAMAWQSYISKGGVRPPSAPPHP